MPLRIADEIRSVAIAIPDTGLLELPTNPTIRDDTVAKKKPNMIMIIALRRFTGIAGINHIIIASTPIPNTTNIIGISLVNLDSTPSAFLPYPLSACLNVLTISGNDLIKLIIPPAATAPAPI